MYATRMHHTKGNVSTEQAVVAQCGACVGRVGVPLWRVRMGCGGGRPRHAARAREIRFTKKARGRPRPVPAPYCALPIGANPGAGVTLTEVKISHVST